MGHGDCTSAVGVGGGCLDDKTEVKERTQMFGPGARNVGITVLNDFESKVTVVHWFLPEPVHESGGRAFREPVVLAPGEQAVIFVAFNKNETGPEVERIDIFSARGFSDFAVAAINPKVVMSAIEYWAVVNAI